jgi:hypothetical protein
MLEKNEFDVGFKAGNIDLNKRFLPIKIPTMRGLLGYRVFLIHRNKLPLFQQIKTFEQLKKKAVLGFGSHWPDIKIYHKNGLTTESAPQYKALFRMLNFKRFDFIPRGASEVILELDKF